MRVRIGETRDQSALMENLLFDGSAVKECLNQEFSHPFQNLMHHESNDGGTFNGASSPHESHSSLIHQERVGHSLGRAPGHYNPNLSHPGSNYPTASNVGNGRYKSCYFQESSDSNLGGGSSLLLPSNGNKMPALVDPKWISREVLYPKQISAVMACSDAELYSNKEHFEVGATPAVWSFSEPMSGDSDCIKLRELVQNSPNFKHVAAQSLSGVNLELDNCKAWFPGCISSSIPGDASALSSRIVSKARLSYKHLSQCAPQALQSKQSHLKTCLPAAHFDGSLDAQMYWCSMGNQKFCNEVPGERSSNLPRLSLERMSGFQQQGFCKVQASKSANSLRPWHNILISYHKFKSKQLDACRCQQEFVDRWHVAVCRGLNCRCEEYRDIISHFDKCRTTDCKLCGPVRQVCHIKIINSVPVVKPLPIEKTISELGPRGYVLGDFHHKDFMFLDIQPTPKRMKVESTIQHDDWSLYSVVKPYLVERPIDDKENRMKLNKELSSSMEASAKGVTRNHTADSGGLRTGNMFRSKNDGLLGPGQSFQGPISSATLNREIPCPIGNLGKCLPTTNDTIDNKDLGNNDAFSHPEEIHLVDKYPELDCANTKKVQIDVTFSRQSLNSDGLNVLPEESTNDQEEKTQLIMPVPEHDRVDTKCDSTKSDYQSGTKLEDLKGSGVSLTDFFTAEQIKEHLVSLNQCTEPNAGKEVTGSKTAQTSGSTTCQLCAVDGLTFAAPPMYCSACGVQIKHRSTYYWTLDEMGAQHCFCTLCFSESRGGNISFRGLIFPKAKLQKGKNTAEFDEAWVLCDKCESWQHQICALYNSKRDLEGKVDYVCPRCRLAEIEAKEHVSIPPPFGAQDLPRTKLSDHIERRLFRSLENERKQRVEFLGKSLEEVPGASGLFVRVVLAAKKKLKVKQEFLDIFQDESYPPEFPYKSKVILLFQKVEGVDVLLFAMYVQEYGSECRHPNKRSVYISYLDSVKYFRPEIKTVSGVALRTIVYHEILIGYLDYCKQCGFTTCYIWACPPLRGDDYILYCHPETQKRPNTNKLFQWYKKMLRKAKEDNVVVEYTNLYDYFFIQSGECNSKITAARLPYFDGDYWSGAIEDMIQTIEKDSGGDSRRLKNSMTRRTLKAMGHSDLSVDTTKDILVMQKLGNTILPVKEDFFVVHLQFTCTNCHEAILSGSRWSCNQCSKFHLCSKCLQLKQIPNGLETHTTTHGEKHQLCQIPVTDVAADTEDNDALLDNDFLDNRHSFLNFCQTNHYQFDTLRRAKHSSMMILHHLHKTTTLAMETICSICHHDVMVRWHCGTCSEFHVCDVCYQKEGNGCHIHKLSQHLTKADCRRKSEQIQQQRASQVRMLLDLLEHANQCQATRDNPCSAFQKCFQLRKLFLHNPECELRVAGGCYHCKKIWSLLRLHAQNCKKSNCGIPRCMDIKRHKEMNATKSEREQKTAVTGQQPQH